MQLFNYTVHQLTYFFAVYRGRVCICMGVNDSVPNFILTAVLAGMKPVSQAPTWVTNTTDIAYSYKFSMKFYGHLVTQFLLFKVQLLSDHNEKKRKSYYSYNVCLTVQLLGLVKLSLHQFFLAFCDDDVSPSVLKTEYPVVAVDSYCPIMDPITAKTQGQLGILLALGSNTQVCINVLCYAFISFIMHHLSL